MVQPGWHCSGGSHTTKDTCYEVCGDGYLYWYEQGTLECDDDNTDNYDGCTPDCLIEEGWYCMDRVDYETASVCYEICGDGLRFEDASNTNYCDVD